MLLTVWVGLLLKRRKISFPRTLIVLTDKNSQHIDPVCMIFNDNAILLNILNDHRQHTSKDTNESCNIHSRQGSNTEPCLELFLRGLLSTNDQLH